MASNQTTLPNVSENEETLLTGVNENVYEDQSIGAELTKKDINRVAWRSMLLQASFNYERMQASGWLYGLLPALKKIHTNKRDLARAMKGHMGFFNTHPFLVTFVIGIILAMERSKQDVNSIQSTKIAVGAPLGGIGDAMFWLTLLPICGGIGASLALQGSILGAVVFILLFNVVHLGLRFGLAHYAYRMGVAAIPLIKANTKKVGHAAGRVGLFNFNFSASFFQSFFQCFCVVFAHAFFQSSRCRFYQVFSFFQTQASTVSTYRCKIKTEKACAQAQKSQEDGCFSAHCRKVFRVCGSASLNQYFSRCSVST